MSTREEFRHHVEALLGNLTDAQQRRGAFEEDEDSIPLVARIIHIAVAPEGLLDKTPVNPPVLRQIASQIRALPLVSRIVREYDNILDFDQRTEGGDLEALKFKLREMIEYLDTPQPSEPNAHQEAQDRTSSVITRRPRRRRGHRGESRKNLSVSERRAQTVAQIFEELNRLRGRMTGAESDYQALRKENSHFRTFKVANKFPELKEKVLNLQGHRQHKRLAQELAAALHGVKLNTILMDWNRNKPKKYRQPSHK
jgi:hypothetical protein